MSNYNPNRKRKKVSTTCPNPLFIKFITKWIDEAAKKGIKSEFTYKKALRSLEKYPVPLGSGRECKILEHFGDKICKMLDEELQKHISLHGSADVGLTVDSSSEDDLERVHYGGLSVPPPPREKPSKSNGSLTTASNRSSTHFTNTGDRAYVPTPGTGPYAILVTLCKKHQLQGVGCMSKKELMDEAQEICDKSFTIPDPGSRYTAWSSMGTLVKKGYVIKQGSPAKYTITKSGADLAETLMVHGTSEENSREEELRFRVGAADTHQNRCTEPVTSGNKISAKGKAKRLKKETGSYKVHSLSESEDDVLPRKSASDPITSYSTPFNAKEVESGKFASSDSEDESHHTIKTQQNKGGFYFVYMDFSLEEVKIKDQASVTVGDDYVGFLIKARHRDLLSSGKRFEIDQEHSATGDSVYAYLHNTDAPEHANPPPVSILDIQTTSITKTVPRETMSSQTAGSLLALETHNYRQASMTASRSISRLDSQLSIASQASLMSDIDFSEEIESLPAEQPKFTLFPGTFDVLLCVDNCEVSGGIEGEINKRRVPMNTRKLQVGDFLWVAKEKHGPRELVLDYVVERKRIDDLASSITDGRFKEQKYRLRNCGLTNPCYLVEDYGSAQHLSLPEDTLNQAITNTQIIDQLYVKRTKDIKESGAYLTIMTKYVDELYSDKVLHAYSKSYVTKTKKLLGNTLGVKEIALMTFEEFNDCSVKSRAMSVKETFARHLIQVGGLTVEKAEAVLKAYPTPDSLIRAYSRCSVAQSELLLKEIKFGTTKRSIGAQLSKALSLLYNTDTFATSS